MKYKNAFFILLKVHFIKDILTLFKKNKNNKRNLKDFVSFLLKIPLNIFKIKIPFFFKF